MAKRRFKNKKNKTGIETNYNIVKTTHNGDGFAFQDPISGIKFYGGGLFREVRIDPSKVTIDLTGGVDDLLKASLPDLFPSITKQRGIILTVKIDDYDIPKHLSRDFWEGLVYDLRAIGEDVLVCCHGGTGRTGLTLSIFAGIMMGIDSPIAHIRKHYKRTAVETDKQVAYVKHITGTNENIRKCYNHWGVLENRYQKNTVESTKHPKDKIKMGSDAEAIKDYLHWEEEEIAKEGTDKPKDRECGYGIGGFLKAGME